jgi:hypothetical protein
MHDSGMRSDTTWDNNRTRREAEPKMSYAKARECFSENKALSSTVTEPKEYNVNLGLLELTEAIQSDLSAMKESLRQIATAIERQGRR